MKTLDNLKGDHGRSSWELPFAFFPNIILMPVYREPLDVFFRSIL